MPIPFGFPPPDPGVELFVASRGMAQGLSQTDGIQVIPRAYVRIGALQLGGQWRNISNPTANGVAAVFARISRRAGIVQLELGAAYRIRTGTAVRRDSRAWEFSLAARAAFGAAALRFSAEYSPREFETGASLYVEGGASYNLGGGASASLNLGRREREGGPDYATLNAGLTRIFWGKLSLDARIYATNRNALGERYRQRFILSARLAL